MEDRKRKTEEMFKGMVKAREQQIDKKKPSQNFDSIMKEQDKFGT